MNKIKKFISEVLIELKKVSWLTKRELLDSTWIVIISSACLGVFIGVSDRVLSEIIGIFIQ